MILETKFNIGDKVWTYHRESGREDSTHHVDGPFTIGRVSKTVTDSPGVEGEAMFNNYMPSKKTEENYMCVETGIGSGQVHSVEKLYLSYKEAKAVVDFINNGNLKSGE